MYYKGNAYNNISLIIVLEFSHVYDVEVRNIVLKSTKIAEEFKPAMPSIHDRPIEAMERSECGQWEGDTVLGKARKAFIVTLADRKFRVLYSKIKY